LTQAAKSDDVVALSFYVQQVFKEFVPHFAIQMNTNDGYFPEKAM
jgi:hypothetical protein